MSLKLLAIDLGKRSFHFHGIDSDGVIISRKTSRSKLFETIKELVPETIAMEACASAHFWGRRFLAAGHQVLLINPRFVKPFVKGSKNDAADAEGIYEAAMRPTMRFVPVKSTEQQDLQSLHRARDHIVCSRTALINHMRGLLGEYGVILPQGAWRLLAQARDAIADAEFLILHGHSSATCSKSSSASISGLISLIDSSWLFAGRTKLAGASRSCQASGRWSQQRSSPRLTMATIFGLGGNSRHGSALCLANIRPAANPGSAGLAGAPIIISAGR